MSADIIAWLRSPEGEEWSRGQGRNRFFEGETPLEWKQGPGDPCEDPCGRPALNAGKPAEGAA